MEGYGKGVLIIGNGFDIDLGLKSRYSDFAMSKLWIDNIDAKINEYSSDGLMKSLINAKNKENWFDIEQTMLDYVLDLMELYDKTNYEFESNDKDKEAYTLVCQLLKQYLIHESDSVSIKKESIAAKVLDNICASTIFSTIYSFNYTDIHNFFRKQGIEIFPQIYHVHGSILDGDDIILGVESEDKILPKEYTFLYKTSSDYYCSNNIYESLRQADDVVFFGHSIDGMDFKYFRKFFETASSENTDDYKRKYIRIFTGDHESKLDIEYNFRKNGIDPFDLYRLNDIDFIYSINCENGDKHENQKLQIFLDYLKNKSGANRVFMPKVVG